MFEYVDSECTCLWAFQHMHAKQQTPVVDTDFGNTARKAILALTLIEHAKRLPECLIDPPVNRVKAVIYIGRQICKYYVLSSSNCIYFLCDMFPEIQKSAYLLIGIFASYYHLNLTLYSVLGLACRR